MNLREYYANLQTSDLYLPECLNWTHFRFFLPQPMKVKDIIKEPQRLLDLLRFYAPEHVFYTPSKFMDPTIIRKKGMDLSSNNFLFSPEYVLDVDRKELKDAKEATIKLLDHLYANNWIPNLIVFSGHKGWHIHLPFGFRSDSVDPRTREQETKQIKSSITEELQKIATTDTIPSWDTRRIIRLPGTIHGTTGNLVEAVKREDIKDYEPKHIVEIEHPIMFKDYL